MNGQEEFCNKSNQSRLWSCGLLVGMVVSFIFIVPFVLAGEVSKGDRLFAIDLNQSEKGGFEQSIGIGKRAGSEAVTMSLQWDELEPSPKRFKPNPNWLPLANSYYPQAGMQVALMINPIDTGKLRMPSDLIEKTFDNKEVISRFMRLLDWVFTQIPNVQLVTLAIGNEIDAYLKSDLKKWNSYAKFFEEVARYAHRKRSNLLVGTKIMSYGFMDDRIKPFVIRLGRASDVYMVTYYPLNSNFTVRNPKDVNSDLGNILMRFPKKPFYLMEIGYPSSPFCNSSDEKQAEFVRQVFQVWDRYGDRIPFVSFTWLSDLSESSVHKYSDYYGSQDIKFKEFLRTLGLRTYPGRGQDKIALRVLRQEANRRGWKAR